MNTKIIGTIGPYTEKPEVFDKLVLAGMDIARVNFSHATYDQYIRIQSEAKKAEKKYGKKISLLFDLCGPRIRVGKLPDEGLKMREGESYIFSASPKNQKHNPQIIEINDSSLHKDAKKGEPLFLVNGAIELQITKIENGNIHTEVKKGGTLFSNKGINMPGTYYSRGSMTKKDIEDAKFGLAQGFDYIALSFVQTGDDIKKLRKILGDSEKKIKIIPKIERPQALENIDEIIKESDGLMIARGDLSIEVPQEKVPMIQKDLIRHAHWHGKPAIVATQMMMSMISHSRPTCAEVSDIANAVYQSADAVMFSDETAVGKHPVEVIKTAKSIIDATEKYMTRKESLFA